jgi:hypothetical protein
MPPTGLQFFPLASPFVLGLLFLLGLWSQACWRCRMSWGSGIKAAQQTNPTKRGSSPRCSSHGEAST